MTNKIEQLNTMLSPAIEGLPQGVFLWGIEYVPGARQSLLRIYIDAADRPVNLEDCEAVSREVSALLDVEDPIAGHYNLEVSSPGLDRPLFEAAHYQRFIGDVAKLALVVPQAGRRRLQGRIVSVQGTEVTVADEQGEVKVDVGNVQKARLVPQFDDTSKPKRQRRGKQGSEQSSEQDEESAE
ncbi:ribosome maturation factor RimP [Pseudomarimonas arenosa]|uniref:Ribosome maturation factor RimP n=1 Tax=Pseudomarimonas arenosa TaxID=2774145 RepID=A0AAW3ZK72_9GAMM|nr:ribosome maturation factor RimP [Pseudomarimonas arenosa]MBD8525919.1 ribosome maturation factor RimP [Pseudomarimonas arenosa]